MSNSLSASASQNASFSSVRASGKIIKQFNLSCFNVCVTLIKCLN